MGIGRIKGIILSDATVSSVITKLESGAYSNGGDLAPVVTNAKKLGQDTYTLFMLIGLFGGVCMLILSLISLMMSSKGMQRETAKSRIVWVIVGVIGVVTSVAIVSMFIKAGTGLT